MIEQLHYEVEFAVVICKYLHRQTPDQAMPAIFGYTLLNDVSAGDVQFKDNQITLGKNFAGFAPIGPWIVIADAMATSRPARAENKVERQSDAERDHGRLAVLVAAVDRASGVGDAAGAGRYRHHRHAGRQENQT